MGTNDNSADSKLTDRMNDNLKGVMKRVGACSSSLVRVGSVAFAHTACSRSNTRSACGTAYGCLQRRHRGTVTRLLFQQLRGSRRSIQRVHPVDVPLLGCLVQMAAEGHLLVSFQGRVEDQATIPHIERALQRRQRKIRGGKMDE